MKMDSCCCGNKIKKEKKGRKPKRFHLAKILVLMQFKTKLLLLFEVNMPTFFIIYVQSLFTFLKLPLQRKCVKFLNHSEIPICFKPNSNGHF